MKGDLSMLTMSTIITTILIGIVVIAIFIAAVVLILKRISLGGNEDQRTSQSMQVQAQLKSDVGIGMQQPRIR